MVNIHNNIPQHETKIKKKKSCHKPKCDFVYEDQMWSLYKSFSIYNGSKSVVHSVINRNFSIAEKIKNNGKTQEDRDAAHNYLEFGYIYGILQLPTHITTTALYESLLLNSLSRLL